MAGNGGDSLKQTLKRPSNPIAAPTKTSPVKQPEKEVPITVTEVDDKEAEDSDSYDFNPVCENCAG